MDKVILQSLSSDLKRIALSIQRNSPRSATRFQEEALRWLNESRNKVNLQTNPSISKLLRKIGECLRENNDLKKAEDLLMYSTLIQNKTLIL